jgi:GTP-binding protein HflX
MIETKVQVETAVIVGIINKDQDEKLESEYLEELAFLVDTAGGIVTKKFTQKLEYANPRTFVGEGKLAEISAFVKENEIDFVVFDDELTPSQLRNLEKELGCKILDRTNLILDIFANRAQTSHAKTQVELAQLQYLLPRLVGMWTHLERQRGGIGLRGPGETEIETDRRVIRERIAWLKEKLKKIDKQMATQRKNREKMIRVSLVGYTNVGKSTIMNMLSKSNVFAENKLFATLDTTVRKVVVGNLPFLLSDTVGFIRKLPHHLIESFKSTLDEVRESDILLHIVDISHPSFEEQLNTVNETLRDLKVTEKPIFIVFNKIDLYKSIPKEEDDLSEITEENWTLEELQKSWMAKSNTPCLFISATNKTNLEVLRETIYQKVKEVHITRYPYDNFLF